MAAKRIGSSLCLVLAAQLAPHAAAAECKAPQLPAERLEEEMSFGLLQIEAQRSQPALDPLTTSRVFCAVSNDAVIAVSQELEEAKRALEQLPKGNVGPPRMVCQMNGTQPLEDVGQVGGQAGGMPNGFNTLWLDKTDMLRMVSVCEQDKQCTNTTGVLPQYCVVKVDEVMEVTRDLQTAKNKLKEFPKDTTTSRMICSAKDGVVSQNPGLVGGQAFGVDAGYNRHWESMDDVSRMLSICQQDRACSSGKPTV